MHNSLPPIEIPGPFVVLQGMPGDGMANTIDSMPQIQNVTIAPSTSTVTEMSSSGNNDGNGGIVLSNVESTITASGIRCPIRTSPLFGTRFNELPSFTRFNCRNNPSINIEANIVASAITTGIVTTTPSTVESFVVIPSIGESSNRDDSDNAQISSDNSTAPNESMVSSNHLAQQLEEEEAINKWNLECRELEQFQRNEMLSNRTFCTQRSAMINTGNESNVISSNGNKLDWIQNRDQKQWWKHTESGFLLVFDSLPSLKHKPPEDQTHVKIGKVMGQVAPGITVIATELVTLNRELSQVLFCQDQDRICDSDIQPLQHYRGRAGKGSCHFLRIESPLEGYIVYDIDGHTYLGPGLPSSFCDPENWMWRVICPDGAWVRDGLELESRHSSTIPYGSLLKVTRKTVNDSGLSRLLIESTVVGETSDTQQNSSYEEMKEAGNTALSSTSSDPKIIGWVSENLNPLSGQRGKIIEPLPFPLPSTYKVTIKEGAIIRSGVELSSSQIGHAEEGSLLSITGRAYSEHPMDKCIERLRLAGDGGWISVRLNKLPPNNKVVVENVDIDGDFRPEKAGLYHLEKQLQVIKEFDYLRYSFNSIGSNGVGDNMSHIHEEEVVESTTSTEYRSSEELNKSHDVTVNNMHPAKVSKRNENRIASSSSNSNGLVSDDNCVICLSDKKTATIVHGETGHVACCLTCARILKARGDRCPVCRLPIDLVIQQFWV